MAALKPNVHKKPSLPPKPCLQSLPGPNPTQRGVAGDRVISRIEPGTVKLRARSLTSKQDSSGEGLSGKMSKAAIQRSTGTVREQIQKLTPSKEREEKRQENSQIETKEERETGVKDTSSDHVEHGRSEPDGSEMKDSEGLARLEDAGSNMPSCPTQEKHCHCICHLQWPGMKLVWVPLQTDEKNTEMVENDRNQSSKGSLKREDERIKDEKDSRGHRQSLSYNHTASVKYPTMPQCINCQNFLLHHSPQKLAESECVYESVEALLHQPTPVASLPLAQQEQQTDSPPTDEPVYLELLPSDENTPTPPTPPPRPMPPPRPQPSQPNCQKDGRTTKSALAYVVSPRGGWIRTPSTCERGTEAPSTRKPKLVNHFPEGLGSNGKDSETAEETNVKESESPRRISNDWVPNSDYEPLYQMYQRKVCETECQLQCGSPSSFRRSSLGLQGSGTPGSRKRELGEVKLWQDLPVVKESGILQTLTYMEKQRQECMFEVLTSEASYLRSLRVLKDHFLGSRELDDTLVVHDRKSLFSNVLQVYDVSERFMQDLLDRVDESVLISDVCDIIHQHAKEHFSVYIDYVRNQVYQEQTYSRLICSSVDLRRRMFEAHCARSCYKTIFKEQCNRAFYTVMRRLEESTLCRRLPFSSFMLLPFQRITRIKILIQSILKRTVEGSAEESSASRALAVVSEIIREANTQVGQMKQMEEMMHIANILEFNKLKAIPLVSKTRWLEKQGELQVLNKSGSLFGLRFRFTPVYIFLFNDLLILTARKSVTPERFVVLDHAHRSLVQVQPLDLSGTQLEHTICLTLLENHQGNTCEHLLKANTESDLHRWMAMFPSVSAQEEKEEKVYEDWDCPQVQCIRQYVAKQTDELSLECCDIINVTRKTTEGWCEGVRLSDRAKGWFPKDSVTEVTNEHQRRRNLREQYRIAMATQHPITERKFNTASQSE